MSIHLQDFLKALHEDLAKHPKIDGNEIVINKKRYHLENALDFILHNVTTALKNPVLAQSKEMREEIQGIISQLKGLEHRATIKTQKVSIDHLQRVIKELEDLINK